MKFILSLPHYYIYFPSLIIKIEAGAGGNHGKSDATRYWTLDSSEEDEDEDDEPVAMPLLYGSGRPSDADFYGISRGLGGGYRKKRSNKRARSNSSFR